jgi:neutral ceramidase
MTSCIPIKSLRLSWSIYFGFILAYSCCSEEPRWKAGLAKTIITPAKPLWLAGYANRTRPAEGKLMDLWIKVLALEDNHGHRAIILTSDTLGIPQSIYQHVSARVTEKFGLASAQVVLSASHTHCGPVLRSALFDMYPLDEGQQALIEKYSAELEEKIIETIGKALDDLSPARLAAGQGTAGFAVNRRNNIEKDVPSLIERQALKGPVDHAVPTLAVFDADGQLKAVLFGYACHNTVMDFYQWSGDYAGFAQLVLERSHPGATAMFFMGCGGDQNPLPRRRPELAERYGNMLAAAVEETLRGPLQPLSPELQTSMEMVKLKLGPTPTEADLEKMMTEGGPTRRWATNLLAQIQERKLLMRDYPFPLQVWRLGKSQLLITLGGEPTVEYALKFKREFGEQTWVAGYCNDVMTYIPSRKVLEEGGYEGGRAMIVYGLPALRWNDDVEDLLTASARRQIAHIRSSGKESGR